MPSRTLQLLIQTLNANRNYQIKWYGQFSLLFYSSFSFTWHMSKVCEKRELAKLFRIPCSCGSWLNVIIGCESFLSVNLYVIRMSLSTVFVLLQSDSRTLWLWSLSFDLLSKCLLNLESIPSGKMIMENVKIQGPKTIVFGHLWTLIIS